MNNSNNKNFEKLRNTRVSNLIYPNGLTHLATGHLIGGVLIGLLEIRKL